jgi:hypothetical protein
VCDVTGVRRTIEITAGTRVHALNVICQVPYLSYSTYKAPKKSKAIPVTGRTDLQGCDMLRIPHCLDNRLIDGGKVISLTHRPLSTPQKHYFFNVSGTQFC